MLPLANAQTFSSWQTQENHVAAVVPGFERGPFNADPGEDANSYWQPVTVDPIFDHREFTYSPETGLLTSEGAGLLACYWARNGVSQLFVLSQSAESTPIIGQCGLARPMKG